MKTLVQSVTAAALATVALTVFTPQPLVFAAQVAQSAAAHASQAERVTRLTVRLTGAASDAGEIWVGLYAGEEAYDDGTEIASVFLPLADGSAETVFEGLKPGEYGIIAFHDANEDGDFTRNFIGIPQERYGFSNNPRPRFRAARWDEAVFVLDGEAEAQIDVALMGAGG
jgi:uncharacterized protein (DUF2141 family)